MSEQSVNPSAHCSCCSKITQGRRRRFAMSTLVFIILSLVQFLVAILSAEEPGVRISWALLYGFYLPVSALTTALFHSILYLFPTDSSK